MRRFAPPVPGTCAVRVCLGVLTALALSVPAAIVDVSAQSQALPMPLPGRNVNMVSGTNFPDGDPFLQRQNEPSIAVSTRNPRHLLGAANDYRTVDIPGLGDEVVGDAWLGIFKSFDGGATWKSTLLPGFRQDPTPEGKASPLYGLEAAADPVMRAGSNGLFYLAGMAFNRDQDSGKVFVARYIDNNNKERGDTIGYLGTTVVDVGSETRFLDKPWMAVDIPRAMKGRGRDDDDDRRERGRYRDKRDPDWNRERDRRRPQGDADQRRRPPAGPTCTIPGQPLPIPAGTIYVMYSAFIDPPAASTNAAQSDQERRRRADEEPDGGFERWKRRDRENSANHKPGRPMEGRTVIMLARSTDCGQTFSPPQKISERTQINQGSTAAIDPNTGDVYVAWREFRSSREPDAILVVRSTDGGRTFSNPDTVAIINPFDQGTTATSFRTNSYPTMTVDAGGRVYVAWAQRGIGPNGDARIVVSSSTNGRRWSAPVPADNHPGRGHQIMPVLSFAGGKLNLVFWDARHDASGIFEAFIDDLDVLKRPVAPGQTRKRHTLDLQAVAGWPGAPPAWGPSVRLSNYLEGVRPGKSPLDATGTPISEQLQYNAPNLPLFSLGTKPFIGDYLDVTASPGFIANGDGTWRFNTVLSDPSMYFTAFSDNRDVRPPTDPLGDINANGNFWDDYTPPTFAGWTGTSIFDPTQPVEICSPGRAGMRDQNIYSNKVQSGLLLTTLGNSKPLGFVTDPDGTQRLIQRSFVVTITNPDPVNKALVLHINSQPPGGQASFLQFDQLIDLPINVAAKSSVSREVFVTSTDPRAAVPVTVTEGSSTAAAGRVVINPDPTNPDIENPDIENPDIENPDIENAEAHAVTVSNPTVSNPDIENLVKANPDIENPDIENPDIENRTVSNLAVLNPDIENPDIENPDIENPDIENPDIENPDIENPDIENPDIENAALTDIKWDVSNVGNTATVYQVKLLLRQAQQQRLLQAGVQFQLIVIKKTASPVIGADKCKVVEPDKNLTLLTINSPTFVDPTNDQQFSTIVNPDIENPDIENATVALAPGETAEVVLRVYSPSGDSITDPNAPPGEAPLGDLAGALQDLGQIGVATTSHPVDTLEVNQGNTTPVVEASVPLIITTTLDDGAVQSPYVQELRQTGSVEPFTFVSTPINPAPGLTLSAAGVISGTPLQAGTFPFTVRLTDATGSYATASLQIRVHPPLVPASAPLPGALVNQSYSAVLPATGGFAPYSWTLASGVLPNGVTVAGSGLSGTPQQSGTFSFQAMVTDSAMPPKTAVGPFVLNVTPGATGQTVNVVEDTATPITLTGAGGGPFSFTIGNPPVNGTLSGTGPVVTYTPNQNFTGPDSFTFSVSHGSLTSTFATVSINVTAVNDAPVATPKTVQTPQGVPIPILLTGSDVENSPLTFSIFSQPAAGTGTVTGTPPNVTYNPPLTGFTGTATFTFRANDGSAFSAPATVAVIVGDPPPTAADVRLTLADAPDPAPLGGTVTYTATILNAGPATATGVSVSIGYPAADLRPSSVTPSQGTCSAGTPLVCAMGAIPNGATATVAVTLKAFNRGGTYTVSSSVSAAELDYNTTNNAASQSTLVTGPTTATSDLAVSQTRLPATVAFGANTVYTIVVTNHGPSDATGITLTNTFTSGTALFAGSTASQGSCAAGPSQLTCAVGSLEGGASATYTLTLTANGSTSLSNTAAVSGSQADPTPANNSQTLATPIDNRPPTANADAVSTNEDLAATFQVVSNDTDPDGHALTLTGVGAPSTPGAGTLQASGNAVLYSPAANFNGTFTFTYDISDGNGGSSGATATVTVLAVNDAPSFVKGADVTAAENGGAQTVANWANPATFSSGPANESGQALQFVTSSSQPLFEVPPAIALDGTLTFTPKLDAVGTTTITVYLTDNGGTTHGGVDTSAAQTFTITLSPVNSAPSFVKGPNQTVPEDSDTQTVVNWATFIKPGPDDEAGQSVTFIVTTNNDDLFATLPSITPDGTLSYKPAPNAFGSAEVFVVLRDDGGAPPGTDTSAPQSFFIAVTAQVDPLAAVDDAAITAPATPVDINVVGNDTGPTAVPPGRLVAFERFAPPTTSLNLGFVNEAARVPSSGYLYVSGTRGIAVIHPSTNNVVTTIDHSSLGFSGANFHQVNGTASIVYFRHAPATITAIDGRGTSPTFNQIIGRLHLGNNVQSFAVDETRQLLYVVHTSAGLEVSFQARLSIVDANPDSGTFHEVVAELALPANGRGLTLDPASDRLYIAGDQGGLYRVDNASQPARSLTVVNVNTSLLDVIFHNGRIYGYGGLGRVIAYDPSTQAVNTLTLPNFTTGFVAGRRFVAHTASNRLFIRSSGITGAPGRVVAFSGDTATWPNAILADIAVGRDGAADLIVDQARGLVITSSQVDYRVTVIDAAATPPAVSGAEQALQVSGDLLLDPTAGRVYVPTLTILQRLSLTPRSVLSPIQLGAENGFAVALPGPAGALNVNRFYIGRTALGAAVRQYKTNGTPSNAGLPHTTGRIAFSVGNLSTNRLYVLNSGANSTGAASLPSSLAAINAATGAVVANVDVGGNAFGLGINETTNKIYVPGGAVGTAQGTITVVDGATHAVTQVDVSAFPPNTNFQRYVAPLCVGASCGAVNKVYVQAIQNFDGRVTVAVVDGAANVATAVPPSLGANAVNLIKTSSSLNRVFVGNQPEALGANDVIVLDGASDAEIATLSGVSSPTTALTTQSYVAVDEQRGRVYLTDFVNDRLTILNGLIESGCSTSSAAPSATCYPVLATIATGDGPSSIAIDAAANRIYVANTNDRSLTFVDGATFKVLGRLVLPLPPTQLSLDTSSPAQTYIIAAGSINDPGAMLITDTRGGGVLSVAPATLTQPASGSAGVNADGTVRYSPSGGFTGFDTFSYRVTDGVNTSANAATVTVNVRPPLQFTTSALADAETGVAYTQQVGVSGGVPPYVWTFSGQMPNGLHPNNATGAITGTPTNHGSFNVTVQVRDSANPQALVQRTFVLVVGPFDIIGGLPTATLNQPYSGQIRAGGSANEPYSFELAEGSAPLPPGLSLSASGLVSGTPTQATCAAASFTVRASDSSLPARTATRTLTIFFAGPQMITTPSLMGAAVLETPPPIQSSCGSGTRTFTLDGGSAPPTGVTLNAAGFWTGQPRLHGDFPLVITATDATGSITKNVTMRVMAREQQSFSQSGGGQVAFGAATRVAQVITVGAHGMLQGAGSTNITCTTSGTPVTVEVQRLTLDGRPDGTTIAAGTATTGYGQVPLSPEVPVAIDERLALVVSAPAACTFNLVPSGDPYQAGDAFKDTGAGWVPLSQTPDARYDLSSFRTLITPARPVSYHTFGRSSLTATPLNDGRVLLFGSTGTGALYDPATDTSTDTVAAAAGRNGHTATRFGPDGKVLIVGGRQTGQPTTVRLAAVEIFDPATGSYTTLPSQLAIARDNHRAVLLADGRVLILGGNTNTGRTASTELFDPGTQTIVPGANMLTAREQFTATLLTSGKVLVTGGFTNCCGPTAEVFDPSTGQFTAAGPMVVGNRGQGTATRLADGRVLIAGGQSGDLRHEAEIYNPDTNTFAATGSLAVKRMLHTATLLPDGSVLVAGGYHEQPNGSYILPSASLERFIPSSETFVPAGGMVARRQNFESVLLHTNRVLHIGGSSQSWMSGNTGELYDPASALSLSPTTLADAQPEQPYGPVIFTASPAAAAVTLVSGALPQGLSYAAATRTLAGTPAAGTTGVYPLGFQVSDGPANAMVQSLLLRVGSILTITSPYRLPDAAVNTQYSVQLTAAGAAAATLEWSLAPASNALPNGLILTTSGVIQPGGGFTGPTVPGFFNFVVRARDTVTGQVATRSLSINVNLPLTINTTTLPMGELFGGGPGCISVSNGVGTRAFNLSGNVPPGLAIDAFNGCFSGTFTTTGTFTFTVNVADQSSPPQTASRQYSLDVWAIDQQSFPGPGLPDVTFGSTIRLAQRVIAGISGTVRAVRIHNLQCAAGTTVTVRIEGLNPAGAPDGIAVTDGTAAAFSSFASTLTVPLNGGAFFGADAQFTIVLSAPAACTVFPQSHDSYPGAAYFSLGSDPWEPLRAVDGHDLPFATLIEPVNGVISATAWRGDHTQTVLAGGQVLVAGGFGTNSAELFNPGTNSFAPTGAMLAHRNGHAAVRLSSDHGSKVLITGGSSPNNTRLASAELYDPSTGTFSATGSMGTARAGHTATLLADGKVLIAGGFAQNGNSLNSAELFDPAAGTFSPLPNMFGFRNEHTATRLDDGRVLITGGYGAGSGAELFVPGLMSFAMTGSMSVSRAQHTATLLGSGEVLITGGTGNSGEAVSSAEIFAPDGGPAQDGEFRGAGHMRHPRVGHAAAALHDGSVLISGGRRDNFCCPTLEPTATIERYVPGSGFEDAGAMRASRHNHTMATLDDGRVLIAGTGGMSSAAPRLAELYDEAQTPRLVNAQSQGQKNQPFGFTLQATGGSGAPYTIVHVSGALPANITYDQNTRTFSGTTPQAGTFYLTMRVSDGVGAERYEVVTLRFSTVEITTVPTLPAASFGVDYVGVGLSATGEGTITWQLLSGSLPPGLTFDTATGAITGIPTVSCCLYSFTVRATDSLGQTAQKTFSIPVRHPLTIATTTLGDGVAGETYFGCISYSGGLHPLTWTLLGQYPAGLSINSHGCFESTWPANVLRHGGTFPFSVRVQDSSSPAQVDTQSFTIRVHAQDQSPPADFQTQGIAIGASRRVAQVYRASSPFALSGITFFNHLDTCEAGTQITASVWPVTGQPPRPDDSGAPLATATTIQLNGFLNSRLFFASPVTMPQGARFAIAVAISGGSCAGQHWPATDWYREGAAWVNDGLGWEPAIEEIGRYDLPFGTYVMPPDDLRFFSSWRSGQAAATLLDGRVLVVGGDDRIEIYDPASHTISNAPTTLPNTAWRATATTLTNGKVLIVGGQYWNGTQWVAAINALIYNAATGVVEAQVPMPASRFGHRATSLADGKVLVTGGWTIIENQQLTVDSALVFAANGLSFAQLTMTGARTEHTATRLLDGRVLIAGGWTASPWPPTMAEIYDPAIGPNGTFTAVEAQYSRWPSQHTATLIESGPRTGQVLLAGGQTGDYPDLDGGTTFFNPFVDPQLQSPFETGPTLRVPRFQHTATTLPDANKRIVLAGGISNWFDNIATSSIEIYDPATNTLTIAGDLITNRHGHTDSLVSVGGTPMIAFTGGWGSSSLSGRTVEIFDPAAVDLRITTTVLPHGSTTAAYPATTLAAAGGLAPYAFEVAWGELPPGLTLSGNGAVTGSPTAGGVFAFVARVTDFDNTVAYRELTIIVDKLQITSPVTLPAAVAAARYTHQLTASGAGAITWSLESFSTLPGTISLSPSGLLDGEAPDVDQWFFFTVRARDAAGQVTTRSFNLHVSTTGFFAAMNPMSMPRNSHIGVALDTGKVLLAGSEQFNVTSAELYDPQSGMTAPTGSLTEARCYGCASVKLDDGRVLAAGGWNGGPVLSSAELYDPSTGLWSATGSMQAPRLGPTAVKLNSGKVLILGGHNGFTPYASAEVYDPGTGTFTPTATSMNLPRSGAAAVKLTDGRVLVAGGQTPGGLTASAEIYDPATNAFTILGASMITARQPRDATLLPDGRVLFAGGGATPTSAAEVFEPGTGQFTAVGNMSTTRNGHSMVLMPYGKVVVFGGFDVGGGFPLNAEIFDPATNTFAGGSFMLAPRAWATTILLPTGEILITGGSGPGGAFIASVEKYRPQ